MNGFKRFVLIVYVICSALLLAALVLPWYGLWTKQAASLIELDWYFWTLVGLFAVSALGLFIVLLRALFAPRNARVVIAKLDGGKITVTKEAIVSQVEHIIERDGSCETDKIRVRLPRGKASIAVRLRPVFGVNVADRARELHAKLEEGLGLLCGSSCIKDVTLTFVESSDKGTTASRSSSVSSASYARSSATFKPSAHQEARSESRESSVDSEKDSVKEQASEKDAPQDEQLQEQKSSVSGTATPDSE